MIWEYLFNRKALATGSKARGIKGSARTQLQVQHYDAHWTNKKDFRGTAGREGRTEESGLSAMRHGGIRGQWSNIEHRHRDSQGYGRPAGSSRTVTLTPWVRGQ